MKSECSLIQELLPLYLENDVSDETRKIIEEHLAGCQLCKSALEQYAQASDPIPHEAPSDPFDTSDSFKRFIRRAKKYMLGAFIIILFIMSVIGTGAFLTGRQAGRAITYVENEEDVIDYYADKVPGLKRAQREGNYQNIGRSIDLPRDLGTAYFDKIWYAKNTIYVFYHVKPGEGLGKMEDVELSGSMHWDTQHDGGTIQSAPFSGGMHMGEWVSYDGMYYKVLGFLNERERFAPVTEAVIDQLKIDLNLTYIPKTQPFNMKQEHAKVGEIEFPAMFDPAKEQAQTVQVNKSVSIPDGITLDFQDLILEPQMSVLKFKASGLKGRELGYIYGKLTTSAGEEIRLSAWTSHAGEDSYEVELRALDHAPHDASILLSSIQLITDEKLSFELDAKAFRDKMTDTETRQTVNKKIGTYAGTEYALEQLLADERGLYFVILMESPAFNNSIQVFMPGSWATEQDYLKRIQEEGKDVMEVRRRPNLVRLINEKDEFGDMEDYGQTGGGPGQRISMFINKEFVEKSNTITVEVMNLVETISGKWDSE